MAAVSLLITLLKMAGSTSRGSDLGPGSPTL
jgi:hypothetical protein